MKQSRPNLLSQLIKQTQIEFLNMSSDDRLIFIKNYKVLKSYQIFALSKCKKFMTTKEKQLFNEMSESESKNLNKDSLAKQM